jgi:hypothetical protein
MVIRRVDPLSCAKIAGLLYVVLGLVFGAMFSMLATLGVFGGNTPTAPVFPMMFGAAAIVVLPLFYGCMGFVTALVGAFLYNLVAGVVGGVEVEME